MVKRVIFRPIFLIIVTPEYSASANANLASNYVRSIILSPCCSQYSPLSHCIKAAFSEIPTYASFGGGGSHIIKNEIVRV